MAPLVSVRISSGTTSRPCSAISSSESSGMPFSGWQHIAVSYRYRFVATPRILNDLPAACSTGIGVHWSHQILPKHHKPPNRFELSGRDPLPSIPMLQNTLGIRPSYPAPPDGHPLPSMPVLQNTMGIRPSYPAPPDGHPLPSMPMLQNTLGILPSCPALPLPQNAAGILPSYPAEPDSHPFQRVVEQPKSKPQH